MLDLTDTLALTEVEQEAYAGGLRHLRMADDIRDIAPDRLFRYDSHAHVRYGGLLFFVSMEADDHITVPWEEDDEVAQFVRRGRFSTKRPGEIALVSDTYSCRARDYTVDLLDVQALTRHARSERWSSRNAPEGASVRQKAARAVADTVARYRAWLRGEWYYCVITVHLCGSPAYLRQQKHTNGEVWDDMLDSVSAAEAMAGDMSDSLGGIESDQIEYVHETLVGMIESIYAGEAARLLADGICDGTDLLAC